LRELIYLKAAQSDLTQLLTYLAREAGSVPTAQAFVTAIREQCRKLATLPGSLGRPRPELRPDMRSFAFRGYIIFFRYQDDTVEIVNILERHRDVESYFNS
jgi:plasmid stabilization system protein ParE